MEKKLIGITGYKGRIGSYLLKYYPNFIPLPCDVTDYYSVENCIRVYRPDLVLHLAGKSDVDFCEKVENEKVVTDTNLWGTANVCRATETGKIGVLFLSSDHLFSGTSWGNYKESSKPNPVNFYGMSKLVAEGLQKEFEHMKIVRTSYLFDQSRLTSKLGKLWNGEAQLYPTFMFRTFMYLNHFVFSLNYYLDHWDKMPSLLHISGNKNVSWYDFMMKLARELEIQDYKKLIVPRKNQLQNLAPRPLRAGLKTSKAWKLGLPSYSYVEGIRDMIKDL